MSKRKENEEGIALIAEWLQRDFGEFPERMKVAKRIYRKVNWDKGLPPDDAIYMIAQSVMEDMDLDPYALECDIK